MVLNNYEKNWIKKITINNFLNHALTVIFLTPGLNIIFGPNGVGKSAILDAIRFLNQKYSKNGRYNKWGDYFPTGKGYVMLHVINPKTKKESIFKK